MNYRSRWREQLIQLDWQGGLCSLGLLGKHQEPQEQELALPREQQPSTETQLQKLA